MNPRLVYPLLAILGPGVLCSVLVSRLSGYVPQLFIFYGLLAAGVYLFWRTEGEPAASPAASREAEEALRKAKSEIADLQSDLDETREALQTAKAKKPAAEPTKQLDLREPAKDLGAAIDQAELSVPVISEVTVEVGGHVKTVNQSLADIYQSIETLASNAEKPSSTIL